MAEIIGVRLKKGGKIYYFDPKGQVIEKNQPVIVEGTDDWGEVVTR